MRCTLKVLLIIIGTVILTVVGIFAFLFEILNSLPGWSGGGGGDPNPAPTTLQLASWNIRVFSDRSRDDDFSQQHPTLFTDSTAEQ